MLSKVYGSAVFGIDAFTITVEVNVDNGIGYHLVGLPDNAVKESNFRIAAALQNNGYKIPGKNIIINMSPADMRKEGSAYDLTLALGILAASEQINAPKLEQYIVMGELSLDGSLKPIKGVLPIAINASEAGFSGFILPKANAKEAAIVKDLNVFAAAHISEVINFFNKNIPLEKTEFDIHAEFRKSFNLPEFDFADVKGQESVKRCMEIAAAVGHNIIFDWTSRLWQNHVGQKITFNITANDSAGGFRDNQNTFCCRKTATKCWAFNGAPVSLASSHHL
jgi:magnesium chelatase family protein